MIILESPRQIDCMRAAGRPDEVVHGIPGLREVKAGDIISIDIGVTYDGYVGDSAFTHFEHTIAITTAGPEILTRA